MTTPPVPTEGEGVTDGLSRLRLMNVDRTRLPVRGRIRSRGVPNALQSHPIVDTTDLGEATVVTEQLLGRSQVTPLSRLAGGFHCRLHAIQFLDVTLAYLHYAVATTVNVHHSTDCFTVHMTSAGSASVHVDGEVPPLTPFFALVISPGTTYALDLEHDSPQMIVRIKREAMERQLSRMLGHRLPEPMVFTHVGDLTTDTAARWHAALPVLSNEVLSPHSLTQQGFGAGPLEELIISTLLYVQESNSSDRLRARPRRSGRVAVRRAWISTPPPSPSSATGDSTPYAGRCSRRGPVRGSR